MESINRREFMHLSTAAGALGANLVLGGATTAPVARGVEKGAGGYVDRIAFGPWMNDTRTSPLPFASWPVDAFDDVTVQSLIDTFELNEQFGYNIYDIFGLFSTWGWPVDIVSAATPERTARVQKVLKAAHRRNIKVICGMGIYSWGFDEIIKAHPEVTSPNQQYPNEHVMCASKEASWEWQKKIVDFMMTWEIDGFHLEAADLGRCTCPECMTKWPRNPAYFCDITARTARYIREKMPDAYIMLTTISWADWTVGFLEEDRAALAAISDTVDCAFDQGHHACYVRPPARKPFIEELKCRFGTSGGIWVYPTCTWDRLQWFLPYPRQTGTHMKELYADGGRGMLYYQGPPNNPGVEINIAFGGECMRHPERSIEENLGAVLTVLYKPKTPAALDSLVALVLAAEDAYFNNMDWDEQHMFLKGLSLFPGPGELHLSRPITGIYGTPDYLFEPHMTFDGRMAYNHALSAVLEQAYAIGDQFEAQEKIVRLQTSILNALMMLRASITTQQWQEQQAAARKQP